MSSYSKHYEQAKVSAGCSSSPLFLFQNPEESNLECLSKGQFLNSIHNMANVNGLNIKHFYQLLNKCACVCGETCTRKCAFVPAYRCMRANV